MRTFVLSLIIALKFTMSCASPSSQLDYSRTTLENISPQPQVNLTQSNEPQLSETPPRQTIPDLMEQAVVHAFRNINKTSPIALVNFATADPEISEALLGTLEHTLVENSFIVVDRSKLDMIREEQNFALSWEVDDATAIRIGKIVSADIIVIGAIDALQQLRIRALNTRTSIVVGTSLIPLPSYINIEPAKQSTPRSPEQLSNTSDLPTIAPPPPPSPSIPQEAGWQKFMETTNLFSTPRILKEGSLSDKLAQLPRIVDSNNVYVLEVDADESLNPHIFSLPGASNVYIALVGIEGNRTISISGNGSLFTIPPNINLLLDTNITLKGHEGNTHSIITVGGGSFVMLEGSTITGNMKQGGDGGGILVYSGSFLMQGGSINNNTTSGKGGGISCSGIFLMTGGSIINNKSGDNGGGINITSISRPDLYKISGGEITNNLSRSNGGGLCISSGGSQETIYRDNMNYYWFSIEGGTISDNTAKKGAGVYNNGNLWVSGGTITNNIASEYGGGIYNNPTEYNPYGSMSKFLPNGNFRKTGGTITGYNDDQSNGNVVRDNEGIIARRGHAIFYTENRRKEVTSRPTDNLNITRDRNRNFSISGSWD